MPTLASVKQTHRKQAATGLAIAAPYFPLQGWDSVRRHLRRWDFPSLGFSLLPFALCLTVLGTHPAARTYGPSHWFATYQHGFLRRALVGELLSGVGFLSSRSIHGIEVALFVLVCSLTAVAFRRILFGSLSERRFAAALLAAPAFLPHMAYMDGELDNFLYLSLLLGAFLLMKLANAKGLAIATVCTIVGLLIHEAFVLLFYPLLLVLAADLVHRRRLKSSWVGVHLALVFAAFLAVIHFGKLAGTPEQWVARAQQRTDMPVDGTVFLVLQCTLRQQLNFVRHLYSPQVLGSILLTVALSIPYGIVLWRLVRTACVFRGYSTVHTRWMLVIFAVPLALSLVGHDVMRWISAICINISLYLLLVYRSTPRIADSDVPDLHESLTAWTDLPAYTATLLYLLALGPWGIAGDRLISNVGALLGR